MLRPLLALFQRALGRDANLSRVYLFRLGLLLAIFVGVLSAQGSAKGAPGLWLLSIIVKIDMIFIIVAGLELFASAVSEEKEEGMRLMEKARTLGEEIRVLYERIKWL